MKHGFVFLLALLLTGCASRDIASRPHFNAVCGCTVSPNADLPNFDVVDDWGGSFVYRGGEPTQKGWDILKNDGVNYVIKLNTDSEGCDAYASKIGMKVVKIPINLWDQTIGKPSAEQVTAIRNALNEGIYCVGRPDGSVYIHCTHGEDRTGLAVGIYRVECLGWSKDKAFSEMMAHGFHPQLRGLYWCWQEDVP